MTASAIGPATDDRVERSPVRLGEEDGARSAGQQVHRVLGDPLEHRRRVERRRDLAPTSARAAISVGLALGLAVEPGVLDRRPDVRGDRRKSRTSSGPKRPSWFVLWTLMTPIASSPARIGTPSHDMAGVPICSPWS